MPASSEEMRKLFCIAYNIKLNKVPKSYSPEAAKMAEKMSLAQLREYCKSPVKEE